MSTSTLPDDASQDQINDYVTSKITGSQEAAAGEPGDTHETDNAPSDEVQEAEENEPLDDEFDESVADGDEEAAEEESESQEEESWIDDDTRGLASAFGLSDEQLLGFSSRDELERALRLLDSHAMAGAREDTSQETVDRHPDHPDRRPDGTLLPKDQRLSKEEPQRHESDFKIELDPEVHGQDVVDAFNNLNQHYQTKFQSLQERSEQRLAALETAEQSRAAKAFEDQFDVTIDALGIPELFGETGKETKEQMQRRDMAMREFLVRQRLHAEAGRSIDLNTSFLKWMVRGAFPEHFSKQQRKALTKKAQRQAGLKMGQSVNKPSDPKVSAREVVRQKYKELQGEA